MGVHVRNYYLEDEYKGILSNLCDYARTSPDPSTQNAAVLCDNYARSSPTRPVWETRAVNEFPRGVDYTDERWERPLKYSVIEHAERNSIFAAACHNIRTKGLTMVCPWAACADCARAIIQSGISRLVTLTPQTEDTHARWDESIDIAMTMLNEAKVEVIYIDGPIMPEDFSILRNGKPFRP